MESATFCLNESGFPSSSDTRTRGICENLLVSLTLAMDCLNVPTDAKIHRVAEYIGKLRRLLYITAIVRYGLLLAVLLGPVAFAQECARTIPFSFFNTAIELGSNELDPGLLQARTGGSQLRITSVEKIPTRRLLLLVD